MNNWSRKGQSTVGGATPEAGHKMYTQTDWTSCVEANLDICLKQKYFLIRKMGKTVKYYKNLTLSRDSW